ncbi:hypothetical protein GGI42DRAFT_259832 [Trichoderma sp. SZMC 28013]
MNGVLAATRPRYDAAGSNSVACLGRKQPQGSPPWIQLRQGTHVVMSSPSSLLPISHLHATRFDWANPFDVTALSIARLAFGRVVCFSGQDGPMACEGFRLPSNGPSQPCTARANSPGRSRARPLETTPENEAPVGGCLPPQWLDVLWSQPVGMLGSTAPPHHIHRQIPHQSHPFG